MTCTLPASLKTSLEERLAKLIARYEALSDAIDKAIESGHLSQIEFDSGEGKQKTVFRNMNEIDKYEKSLLNQIRRIQNRLNCKGLINARLVR